ncbi:NADP-dependent oxidoreductase [Aspergillus saccharolyticus JOP 1030-1]|uniref:Quinone reductase n=1 Tax=Aspergillus saccharolyticus JOP 1030-1 TaxID=1450539 RepID=A0A319ACG2_9EURO|nr:quinone reductase [Aspergillus saccharolyticus JOP 1030-1]PYH44582.1 quinone reductase [Aspergillus saccharolyticus JOP 1030-1]
MQAIRLHPAPPSHPAYSPTNPAPTSALRLDHAIPIPKPTRPDELLIHVHATTIVRDMLTWPETYRHEYTIPGNDLAGTVVEVFDSKDTVSGAYQPGDEVFGMSPADRAATWAEYTVVRTGEIAHKPTGLGWAQAAGLPLSAQTAYEALFVHAGIGVPSLGDAIHNLKKKKKEKDEAAHKLPAKQKLLITGASGAVGIHLVQLAAAAGGLYVVAATSSDARNREFLVDLGADETVEYASLDTRAAEFDSVVDAVGGEVLARCWDYVKPDGGVLVSVDSSSFDFVERHAQRGIRREGVRALFFIVEGSAEALRFVAGLAEDGGLVSLVNRIFAFEEIQEAYELGNGRSEGRGKVVLVR